jgi:uncharacterized membrane protein (DUF106 family)
MIELIFESLQAKLTSVVILTAKFMLDVATSESFLDLLSYDKITTGGLLVTAIYYFFTELKKEKESAQKIIAELKEEQRQLVIQKDAKIEELIKEKEALLLNQIPK